MPSFEQLIREHDAILDSARELEEVAKLSCSNPAAASELLVCLSDKVRSHLLEEDRGVYAGLMVLHLPQIAGEIGDLESHFQALVRDWLGYLDKYVPARVATEWEAFCDETAEMMSKLKRRVDIENALLYPSALQTELIRFCDPR